MVGIGDQALRRAEEFETVDTSRFEDSELDSEKRAPFLPRNASPLGTRPEFAAIARYIQAIAGRSCVSSNKETGP